MRDPYSVLGVGRRANMEDIKLAYRALAKQYHPDMVQSAPQTGGVFQEISQAYGLLSNSTTRADFDRGTIHADGRPTAKSKAQRGAARQPSHPTARPAPPRPSTPAPKAQRATQAPKSHNKPSNNKSIKDVFSKPKSEPAPDKAGPTLRAKADEVVSELFANVKARAKQREPQIGTDEIFSLEINFKESARGTSRRVKLPNGKRLDVKIPAGVLPGQQIRLRGQGNQGKGGAEAGDALIEISITAHEHFRRKENDVYLTVPIGVDEAILGAKIMVPTLDGLVAINVPRHSNTDTTLCLKGQGFPHPGEGPTHRLGNQYVVLKVVLPPAEDSTFARMVAKWAQDNPYNVRREFDFSSSSR